MKLGLLPPNLAALAKCCATEPGRWATHGVRLTITDTGYRADATDGRRLVTVTGDYPEDPASYPHVPALDAAPNGAASAVIAAADWKAAFKLPPTAKKLPPVLRNLAVVLGDEAATFAGATLSEAWATSVRRADAPGEDGYQPRYPDPDQIQPPAGVAPLAQVSFDAALLAEVLTILGQIAGGDYRRVTLTLYPPKAAANSDSLFLETRNDTQHARAVISSLKD